MKRYRRALILGAVSLLLAVTGTYAAVSHLTLPRQLPPTERARLEEIAKNSFASTRVQFEPYPVRPEIWEYLLDHPEFATHVTRALKLARYRIWHNGSEMWVEDGWGVKGRFTFVHKEQGIRIMYARGQFEQKVLPEIQGQAVATLEYSFRSVEGGQTVVVTVASGFVQVDNQVLNALGKMAAPMVQAKADKEVGYLLRTFARVTKAIDEDPAKVYQLVSERPDVPRGDLEGFRRVLRLP